MNQHTQGPWSFKTNWCDMVASDEGVICIIMEDNEKGINRTKLVNRANARLIAASPDLLEALESLIAMDDADGMGVDGWEKRFNVARAAVSRARGQA
jgi:hypothetical protein